MYADREDEIDRIPVLNNDIFDELFTRFLSDPEERKDYNRLMFCIEQAHWHYIDYVCANQNQHLRLTFRKFVIRIVQNYKKILFKEFPKPHMTCDQIIDHFLEYKKKVPTYGCILIDKSLNYCLMVRGANARISWGFPKGKRNQDELPEQCAVRETLEEIGFDCSSYVSVNTDHLDSRYGESTTRLYLVENVDMKTAEFFPATRNEIRDIKWFLIDELPDENKDDDNSRVCEDLRLTHSNFFISIPFITPLRGWCSRKKLEYESRRREMGKPRKKLKPLMMNKMPVCVPVANSEKVEEMLETNNRMCKKTIIPSEKKDREKKCYGNLSRNFEKMFGDSYNIEIKTLPLCSSWSRKAINTIKFFDTSS